MFLFYDTIFQEAAMSMFLLDIKDDEKGRYLLDFLRQIDFLEIRKGEDIKGIGQEKIDKESFEEFLLKAPVLSDEEIKNIESIRF